MQTELQKKKNKKYTNKLNREFKKDFYYNSSNNNIHGITNMDNIMNNNSTNMYGI